MKRLLPLLLLLIATGAGAQKPTPKTPELFSVKNPLQVTTASTATTESSSYTPKGFGFVRSVHATVENDLDTLSIGSSDRYYTNGIRLGITRPLGNPDDLLNDVPIVGLALRRPSRDRPPSQQDYTWLSTDYYVAQNMYTPHDIETPELQTDDRPFAG